MAEHMLQGAWLAEQRGEDDVIVSAALLHDIGHFTGEFGTFAMDDTEDRHHEEAGAKVLERFFPALLVDCVRHHVAAKRYICATDPAYLARLSEASIHSLKLQGGPMSEEESAAFAALPRSAEAAELRRWDDAAKEIGLKTPDFEHFRPHLESALRHRRI